MIEYTKPMNGSEIAKELGISRQAVSYNIRKAIKKMYNYILEEKIAETPFQAVVVLMHALNVSNGDVSDIKGFLKLFDKSVISSIEEEMLRK